MKINDYDGTTTVRSGVESEVKLIKFLVLLEGERTRQGLKDGCL